MSRHRPKLPQANRLEAGANDDGKASLAIRSSSTVMVGQHNWCLALPMSLRR
jgi:hypothetical protein